MNARLVRSSLPWGASRVRQRGRIDDPTSAGAVAQVVPPGDLALARGIWPLLAAQFATVLPVSATGIFLPAMAAEVGRDVGLVGGLRGLGGAAALACAVLAAPLIDRVARARTVAGGLLLLSAAALLAAHASLASLGLFFALAAAAAAVVQPVLQSAAADGRDVATGARAAAIVTTCGAIAPMLAGPLLAAPALVWGWRGDFAALAVGDLLLAVLAGAVLARRPGWRAPATEPPSASWRPPQAPCPCCWARRYALRSSSPGSPIWRLSSRRPRAPPPASSPPPGRWAVRPSSRRTSPWRGSSAQPRRASGGRRSACWGSG